MNLNIQNPPKHYRPAPFWSWNDKLSCEELRRQVRLMHDAGLGGFFMHARGGLQTEYLSGEWMDCVEACIDEAEKLGMDAWLYDENGWPSGFAGGLVNGLGERYQQKYLRYAVVTAAEAEQIKNVIAFYDPETLEFCGDTFPEQLSTAACCYYELNPFYVDNLDPVVVDEFIRVTHEEYYAKLPRRLFNALRGIFTDEPQLSRNGVPWSPVLPAEYAKAYPGCDLIAELPRIFAGSETSFAVRVRYWKLCGFLFSEVFMKRIRLWCDAHNWQLTGHHVLEESCQYQIASNGSITAQYRYYHVPGVDNLGRLAASPVAATQVVSSAAQYGQKQIMTESFAATGWACNFTGMRWIYQGQMAQGINYLCQHLQGYSLRGKRKRDYPSSFFYHQPWWEDYALLNGYFARAGMLLAEGEAPVDLLVSHPLSSAWKHFCGNEKSPILDYYTQTLQKTTEALNKYNVPHHYADEIIVDDCASVDGAKLRIGKCTYSRVLLPQISNISGKLLALLKEFAAAGGLVCKVRNQYPDPFTVDGEPAAREDQLWFEQLPSFDSEDAAAESLAALENAPVCLTEHGVPVSGVACARRYFADLNGREGYFYYLANLRIRNKVDLCISLPATGKYVEMILPESGEFQLLKSSRYGRGDQAALVLDYPLAPAEGVMLFVSDSVAGSKAARQVADPFAGSCIRDISEKWQLAGSSENLLTLDRCRYRVDGGEWQSDDVISLQAILLELKRACRVDMEFEFFAGDDYDCNTALTAVVETPQAFEFSLNGVVFAGEDSGYLFDRAFRRIPLPQAVKPGKNILALSMTYDQSPALYAAVEAAKRFESEYNKLTLDTELESIYLCGNFSVRHIGVSETLIRDAVRFNGRFELAAPLPQAVPEIGDLTGSGMPFFAGKVKFSRKVELTAAEAEEIKFLRLQLNGANSVRASVNGRELPVRCWEPFAFDVGGALKPGENIITLELTTSLRNMLGPHHLADGDSWWVGTLSFNRVADFTGRVPPPYHPGYCMVDLGAKNIELSN